MGKRQIDPFFLHKDMPELRYFKNTFEMFIYYINKENTSISVSHVKKKK